MKVTKRFSHGLDATAAFTWQKELERTSVHNDVFNRELQKRIAANSQPLVFVTAFNYEVPKIGQNKWLNLAASGWTIGGLLRYSSGALLAVPTTLNQINNQTFQPATVMNRVSGQPLFLKDINCGCIDPRKDLVLNPAAWSDAPPGQFGTAAGAYNDFRAQRIPDEQMSLGRTFRMKERMSFHIRAEFFNVFNRTVLPTPNVGNPLATTTRDSSGALTGGFGYVNWTNPGQQRNGQIVARLQW